MKLFCLLGPILLLISTTASASGPTSCRIYSGEASAGDYYFLGSVHGNRVYSGDTSYVLATIKGSLIFSGDTREDRGQGYIVGTVAGDRLYSGKRSKEPGSDYILATFKGSHVYSGDTREDIGPGYVIVTATGCTATQASAGALMLAIIPSSALPF